MSKKSRLDLKEKRSEIAVDSEWSLRSRTLEWRCALSFGALALLIYFITLMPSVGGGDSGELITVAYKLGVAHPPGYPTFTLLGKLFTLISLKTVGWRINLFSAFCSAWAAVFLFLSVYRMTRTFQAALVSAGLFSFSPLVWSYSVTAEVFALNNLFLSLILLLALEIFEKKTPRSVYFFALISGLALTNHLTAIFFIFPFALFALWIAHQNHFLNRKFILKVMGLGLLGMLPYLYLPLASSQVPLIAWGDQTSFEGFLKHLLRKEYGTLKLTGAAANSGGNLDALFVYLMTAFKELLYLGIFLGAFGVIKFYKSEKWKGFIFAALVAFLSYIFVFGALANISLSDRVAQDILARFWQEPNFMLCVWIGLGFYSLSGFLRSIHHLIYSGIAVIILLTQVGLNFSKQDQHLNTGVQQYARALLAALPERALLFSRGDIQSFPIYYIQQCEGFRTDVKVLDQELTKYFWYDRILKKFHPELSASRFLISHDLTQLVDDNRNSFPTFMSDPDPAVLTTLTSRNLQLINFGFVNVLTPKGASIHPIEYERDTQKGFDQIQIKSIESFKQFGWEFLIAHEYWQKKFENGKTLVFHGILSGDDRDSIMAGVKLWEEIERSMSDIGAVLYSHMAMGYTHLIKHDSSAKEKAIQAWKNYIQKIPAGDPGLSDANRELAKLQGDLKN